MKPFIALLILSSVAASQAEKKNAIQRFGESDMAVIRTKVRLTTVVVLPEGEEISEVICGDKEYWVIEGKDSIVYVKPAKEGALTNVNIVSKTKNVYSFMVQEISRPGGSKEKPDLKVLLGGDELAKLRKEKEKLEELVLRTEREKGEADRTKKKESIEPPKKAEGNNTEFPAPEPKPAREPKPALDARVPAQQVAGATTNSSPPPTAVPPAARESVPVFNSMTVARSDGFVRKAGSAIGRFFLRINQALHLY